MGIVNVTPDSFSDGGLHASTQAAIDHGLRLAEEGADILDIGGESTRPGADSVSADEELRRVMPVIEGLRGAYGRADLHRHAQGRGDAPRRRRRRRHPERRLGPDARPGSLRVAAESGLPVILMHAQGDPQNHERDPQYDDVLLDVYDYLEAAHRGLRGGRHSAREASSSTPASASASTCTTMWQCWRA